MEHERTALDEHAAERDRLRAENRRLRQRLAAAEGRVPGGLHGPPDGDLDALWTAIEARLGLCPSFFRLAADTPAVAWGLWRQAEFAYLDSPIPSLFKERLFTHLSQFCAVPYCLVRHCAFLLGRGRPAGDAAAPAAAPGDALALLAEPVPTDDALAEHLAHLAETPGGSAWPDPGTARERALFGCAAAVFLDAPAHPAALRALRRALGDERFHWLALFLAFVRTAHYWTELHPELELEADARALLDEHDALADRLARAAGAPALDLQRERTGLEAVRARLAALEAAQAQSRRSEERLRFALDVAELGQWDLDLEAHTAFRSPRHDQIFGYGEPHPDWTYEVFLDHVLPEDRAAVDAAFQRATTRGGDWDFECRVRRADGAVRWIRARGRVWPESEGDAGRMLGVVADVTDDRQREAALRQSRDRLDLALKAGQMGTWRVDMRADRAAIDAQEAALLGLDPHEQEIDLADFYAATHPDDREAVAEAVARAEARGEDYRAEFRVVHPDGAVRWLAAAGRFIRDADGEPVEAVGFNADVTARKRAEAEVRRMSARLLQAGEQERRAVARELHDELGGLLTSLQMSLSMNPARDPAARAELAESEGLVRAMLAKVRELSLDLRPSVLDDLGLGPAIDQLAERFEGRTGIAVDLHCEVSADDRFPPEVETAAYRVVQEALTNAARHAGADRVQVLCHREPDRLAVHVVDEGRGFDVEAADPAESTGLSAMRERAALVGGRLDVASDPGAGTRVTASIPL